MNTQEQEKKLDKQFINHNYTERTRDIFQLCNKHAPSIQSEMFAWWFQRAFAGTGVGSKIINGYCL